MPQNVSSNLGNNDFYDWVKKNKGIDPNFGGGEGGILSGVSGFTQQNVKNWYGNEYKVDKRYEDVTNFNSPLYQEFRKYYSSLIPQLGANNMIAPLLAGGGSYGGSQKIAQERAEAYNVNRTEAINKGVQEFALGNQAQASGLLNMLLSNQQFMTQLEEQRRQYDESQPTFWDSLLNIIGGVGGMGVGNLMSGKGFFGSSNRGASGAT